MKPFDEQDLLKGARAFDLPTLSSIYDCYSQGLFRYAMRLLGDEMLAEECVGETFSRFLKALRNGQGPQNHLQAYLFRIAHNWITDCYRRQIPPPVEIDESTPDGRQPNLESQVSAIAEQNQVRLALRSLTPEQRLVVTLRFIEDWEIEKVARSLQKPVGAVKALQHRALNALRKLLQEEEKIYGDE